MANLLESYAKRLAVSESVYSKQHNGTKMSNHKKLTVAKVLDNTNKFLTEAFGATVGTQRSDMGEFKKFCLNLTTVSLPNLIANDLVIVSPMSSMTGYVTYVEYNTVDTKLDDKHTIAGGKVNSPFALGDVNPNYTASRVVENVDDGKINLAWTPAAGTVKFEVNGVWVDSEDDGKTVPEGATRVAYAYDNVTVPMAQEAIPALTAKMQSIPLLAKARRIAVYYSQIAAFQAKTDYGFDLGDQLAEKAVGQLSYEIDTEVVNLLDETAGTAAISWSRAHTTGVSKTEHYEGFAEAIEIGRQMIYDKTNDL